MTTPDPAIKQFPCLLDPSLETHRLDRCSPRFCAFSLIAVLPLFLVPPSTCSAGGAAISINLFTQLTAGSRS